MNGNSTLEEEIRERIFKENKAFYANKTLFRSNLVSRKSKLNLYWSVIRPIVVCGCETWVLKKVLNRDCQHLGGKYLGQLGTAVAQWLRCCATNRKVAGSTADGVSGIFH